MPEPQETLISAPQAAPTRKRRARLNPSFQVEQRKNEKLKAIEQQEQREQWLHNKNAQLIREGKKAKTSKPKTNWPLIKPFAEQYGITEASKAFSISYHSIYKHVKKENWNIPNLIAKKPENLKTIENKVIAINENEKWAIRSEQHKETIHNLVSNVFEKAKENGLPPIETPSDAKIYDEVQRKTLGLDKIDDKSQNLQVNLAFLSQP